MAETAKSRHDAVRDWLLQCPSIPKLGFNFAEAADEATYIVPADTLLRSYIDGAQERTYAFQLVRFLPIDFETADNIDMQEEMDALADWVSEQNDAGNLPVFPKGCIVQEVEVLDTEAPYATPVDENLAKYMIPFAVNYLKEANSNG
mgnify:FL=1